MTEVTPNLPHFGSFCKYCFMGTLLWGTPVLYKEAKEELLKLKTAKQNVASFFREEEQTQQER